MEIIEKAVKAGCHLIQVRERDLSASDLAAFVSDVIAIARPEGARVLVNDRVDVALATGADGVHLRSTSLRPETLRSTSPQCQHGQFLIGVSTHSVEEVTRNQDADFVVLGPVFPTASKLEYGDPLGLEVLKDAASSATIPVLGIGGIDANNFHQVLEAGAAGIAAIGLLADSGAVTKNVRAILRTGASRE